MGKCELGLRADLAPPRWLSGWQRHALTLIGLATVYWHSGPVPGSLAAQERAERSATLDGSRSSLRKSLKARLLDEINRDRVRVGVRSVRFSELLSVQADLHSEEMLSTGFVSHWNQAGLKPYMRYSWAGFAHFTSENITAIRATPFDTSSEGLEQAMLLRHRSMVNEVPPMDLHRRSILDAQHTHVGIGLAFNESGLNLIEVYARVYLELEPMPASAASTADVSVRGRVLDPRFDVDYVAVHWEPIPQPLPVETLRIPGPYGFPSQQLVLRRRLPRLRVVDGKAVHPQYTDGSRGEIEIGADGQFSGRIPWYAGASGVYTVVCWLSLKTEVGQGQGFAVTSHSIRID